MKILFYSDNFYPETSGIADSTVALARGLQARGHTVAFAAPKYTTREYAASGRTSDQKSGLEGFQLFRIPSLPFAGSASGQARNVVPLGWTLPFVRRFKPDIIHTQTPFGTGIEALYASRVFNIPLVGTNHTVISEFIKIYGPIRTQWAENLMNRFYSWYYNRCVFVSAVGQGLLDEMKQYGFKREGTVISNPLSLEIFSPAKPGEKEIAKKERKLGDHVIIWVGRVAPDKKPEVTVKAFAQVLKAISDAQLVIVGNGPDEARLKDLVSNLGISRAVIFTGFMDHPTLAPWYKASDVFAIACPIETQGLGLMQAFASGLPAVGVAAGAVGVHIKPDMGYLVPEGDSDAFAASLIKILKDPRKAEAMGENARRYVINFSEPVIAEKWEKIYEQEIAKRSA